MNRIINYTRKNGKQIEVECKGVKGSILYVLIKFCNWLESKVIEDDNQEDVVRKCTRKH